MLELKGITKDYPSGDSVVHALKGISVTFRDQEFVSILGQSGCGKTTLLNIIGGLDQYTKGDLVINGRSTKSYLDRDWDTYRNHSVGFVFQSYNLIPHQSVVRNVEMALLLSGAPKSERRARAEEALRKVGLGDHLNKRPNQLSGGQMQRVAIARAIVNDPELILADEPTGALDTETSVEVMEILKKVSRDRLVIMVTHNPQLAEEYSDRIVRIKDGLLMSDSRPVDAAREALTQEEIQAHAVADARKGKRGMSYASAIGLSFNNLMTKKGRTFLTTFAGSIGIIGIALILSLSTGAQDYINGVEEDTLSSYPITLSREAMDMGSLMSAMMDMGDASKKESLTDALRTNDIMTGTIEKLTSGATKNDLKSFRAHIESDGSHIKENANAIQYGYDAVPYFYKSDTADGIVQLNPSTVYASMGLQQAEGENETQDAMMQMQDSMSGGMSSQNSFKELMDNDTLLAQQYDVVAGRMPRAWNEVVIIATKSGAVSDYMLYNLGLLNQDELRTMMNDAIAGEKVVAPEMKNYAYDDNLGLTMKLVPQTSRYEKVDGVWEDKSQDEAFMKGVVDAAEDVKVVGIIKPSENSSLSEHTGSVGYTAALTQHLLGEVNDSAIVADQKAQPDTDVFSGMAFDAADASSDMSMDQIEAYLDMMPESQRASVQAQLDQARAAGMSDAAIASMFSKSMSSSLGNATYEGNLEKLGASDEDDPSQILIYPKDFEAKEKIADEISDYNTQVKEDGEEDKQIQYTDMVAILMGSVRTIVNSISYILIAFVAISLVVSSIMIGIITYISVLERTKEIGILRAIGASKRDIGRVFNAETLIIGACSGVFALAFTLAMLVPINMIIYQVAGVVNMAKLPLAAGIVLLCISMGLTLIAGLAPSKMAAKKDPVTALRTE